MGGLLANGNVKTGLGPRDRRKRGGLVVVEKRREELTKRHQFV